MNEENAQVIYDLLDRIKVTDENRERMEKISRRRGFLNAMRAECRAERLWPPCRRACHAAFCPCRDQAPF